MIQTKSFGILRRLRKMVESIKALFKGNLSMDSVKLFLKNLTELNIMRDNGSMTKCMEKEK